MATAAKRRQLRRGVYSAPYQIDGCEVLYGVTSAGQRTKKIIVLRPGVAKARAVRWFEELLDRIDPPRPPLKLVTAPPPLKQLTVEQLDALYRDANPVNALLWKRKRAKLLGGRYVPS